MFHALKAAKGVLGIPDSRSYGLADGIQTTLKRIREGPVRHQDQIRRFPPQLELFEA